MGGIPDTSVQTTTVDWAAKYLQYLSRSNKSERTIQAYSLDVRCFVTWFEFHNQETFTPELITSIDLRAYRTHSIDVEAVKPATWNRRLASLNNFCTWCRFEDYLTYDPMSGIEPMEEEKLPPMWLQPNELSRFMRQVELAVNGSNTEHWRWQAVRDMAMIELMLNAGLREGEVCDLLGEDVQISERSGRVIVRRGKGDKRREVPLNYECRKALTTWLDLNGGTMGALFVNKRGEQISRRLVQRRVAEYGKSAGIEVTPHQLRHTFAKRLVDKGVPLSVVAGLLGHARIDTTLRYVQPGWNDFENAVERL